MFRLARALVADPEALPVTDDPLARSAVSQVASELDAYDRLLFARVRTKPQDSSARAGVEAAVAHRLQMARAQLADGITAITSASRSRQDD